MQFILSLLLVWRNNITENNIIVDGDSLTIFTTGSIISEVIDAANLLKEENINCKIINIACIKPLNIKNIIKECSKQKNIFSVEEHNIIGGIGSSIADVIAQNNLDCNLYKIGLNDCFATGYGTHEDIKKMNKFDSISIYETIKNNLK